MKYLAMVLSIWFVACASVPRPVVLNHITVLPLDTTNSTIIGRAKCDLDGYPYVLVSEGLTADERTWVLLHERVHVSAMLRYPGGCDAFVKRYEADKAFRLEAESQAYCGVYFAQLAIQRKPDPDRNGIFWRLRNRYVGPWTDDEIKRALTCW